MRDTHVAETELRKLVRSRMFCRPVCTEKDTYFFKTIDLPLIVSQSCLCSSCSLVKLKASYLMQTNLKESYFAK